ncbi:GntR family transcriptional regulator [Thermus amyloliquefaciens]|uniref:GntR family transcriptional regulator n=1 Tax=Thermus amyloliquefaciens TaxID=1449080 RepID=UPI000570E744|nr:GntR family transcriptional regulator [Thermus amyloliquefaciens]
MGPKYLEVARRLREALLQGIYKEALPPERTLAEALGVSRDSLRKALDLLEEEGLVVRRQGSGTFVAKRATFRTRLLGFSEEMRALGLRPETRVLQVEKGPPTPEEAMALALSPGEGVLRLLRLRLADGEPMALERAALPLWALSEVPEGSLYQALEAKGLRPVRALQRLRAVAAREEARPLGVEPGSPLLHLERVSYLEDGRPVEFVKSWYRADRYELLVELS